MVESSHEPSLSDRVRYSAHKAHALHNSSRADDQRSAGPLDRGPARNDAGLPNASSTSRVSSSKDAAISSSTSNDVADKTSSSPPPPAPPPLDARDGETSASIEPEEKEKNPNIATRFYEALKEIVFSSWINTLLVFVPIGIAVQAAGVNKTIVFAMNAIAIIPLAGLLSHATESVASELGDTIGALMNITFGNAVELIIFMYVNTRGKEWRKSLAALDTPVASGYLLIALTKNEIQIVQASLLGSILANLLLILGMCFLLGGLRFREQIYNNTVTQMSACLLSLSVMSLLLPTAFHASFTDSKTADKAVLQISRGTSIILLLVYVLYLLFQLKSHAYMYQSTPQYKIDEESHPGILADMLGSSSSSDDSSSSSGSDTDGSSGSNTTAKRIKRVLRGRRRRKSSASSKDTPSVPSTLRTPSASTFVFTAEHSEFVEHTVSTPPALGAIASGDEADTDGENEIRPAARRATTINFRDFESEKDGLGTRSPEANPRRKSKRKHRKPKSSHSDAKELEFSEKPALPCVDPLARPSTPRVGFLQNREIPPETSPRRPFNFRGRSVLDVVPAMPAMPKVLSGTVFSTANPTGPSPGGPPIMGTPRALHRSNSLPSRLNQVQAARQQSNPPAQPQPFTAPVNFADTLAKEETAPTKKHMSRTSAIILLLVSTSLVAVCAEFLVSSINYLVSNTGVSEAFVGLIILPIVGNAAEHVTAVTVASKNKMDLAIGVAVGSSIQIALFVTPVIVLLGWILDKDMSLYFSLFETISLFVSAFIVNFLVLDGRSNYLEGALLIAAYVIIALAAFFFPDSGEQSTIGGGKPVQLLLEML